MTQPQNFPSQDQIKNLCLVDKSTDYAVVVGNSYFYYNFAQIAFFSETVFRYFCSNNFPFPIDIPSDGSLSSSGIIKCYSEFDSLFRSNGSSSITITRENQKFFLYFANIIQNLFLITSCLQAASNGRAEFSLQIQALGSLTLASKQIFNNFSFTVNQHPFMINKSLLQCISALPIHHLMEYSITVDPSFFETYKQFFSLFGGEPFNIYEAIKNNQNAFGSLAKNLQISEFSKYSFLESMPTTLEASLRFLAVYGDDSHKDFHDESIRIVQQNLTRAEPSALAQIDITCLQEIFQNAVQIPDENFLADLVLRIIEIDPLKRDLASSLVLPAISSPLMEKLFSEFHFDEIGEKMYEAIKERLLCEVTYSPRSVNRWINPPYWLSINQIKEHKEKEKDLEARVSSLEKDNSDLQNQVDALKAKNNELQGKLTKVGEFLKLRKVLFSSESNPFLNGKTGLSLFLGKQDPSNVKISSSTSDSNFPVENLLEFNKLCWKSLDQQNQSVTFQFPKHKILVKGYSIQSADDNFPRGWKLEASNDGSIWAKIDERLNYELLSRANLLQVFFIKNNETYSFFKLTQIQPNSNNSNIFKCSFIDFAGTSTLNAN